MPNELHIACRLDRLADLQEGLAARIRELGLSPESGRRVQAAAARAFAAVCLARPENSEVRAALERSRGELCLRLVFAGEDEPPGLGPALFCPPALRVAFRRGRGGRGGQGVWTAFWEE